MPRILHVTGAYAPEFSAGGLQSQAAARVLGDRAAFLVLTTATSPALDGRAAVEGIQITRVHVGTGPWRFLRATMRMLAELVRLVQRIDMVHLHGFSTKNILVSVVAKSLRRSIVLHLHTAKHDEPPAVQAQGRMAWWAFRTADLYLSVSPALTAAAVAAGLPANRIRNVHNGVDETRFHPAAEEERVALRGVLGLPLDRPMVLFVGTFSHDKQPHVLLEAWLQMQTDATLASTLVCVGATSPRQFEADASLAARLRERADRAGVGDRLVLAEPTQRIEDYFRAADVFVLPSIREGQPVVLLEAMACGLPCVASRLPGSTDAILEDGVNGRLVEPGNAAAFASAIRDVLAGQMGAARMGTAARATVEVRYTMTRVADEWLAAYHEVLAAR